MSTNDVNSQPKLLDIMGKTASPNSLSGMLILNCFSRYDPRGKTIDCARQFNVPKHF